MLNFGFFIFKQSHFYYFPIFTYFNPNFSNFLIFKTHFIQIFPIKHLSSESTNHLNFFILKVILQNLPFTSIPTFQHFIDSFLFETMAELLIW